LEQGNNLFHCAWVKLFGHVLEAAVTDVAVAFEVESPAVIIRKTKEFKGPDGVGVCGGKPSTKRVILAGRRDSRPEGPKEGMNLGVDLTLGGGVVAGGAAASRGTAVPCCTAAASACVMTVARGGVALVCGSRVGGGRRGGALAEVGREEALGNGEGGAEAFINDAGSGGGMVRAREVALQQLLVGDDVAELAVCLSPEVVHYLAGLFA
jgi:hypothetical protein